MSTVPMNKYLSPEDLLAAQEDILAAEQMAGIEDPEARMLAMSPMAQTAKGLQGIRPMERANGRVVGATSPLEAIGAAGANIAGAYMNKQLMDKYGSVMDDNTAGRKMTAKTLAERAARGAGKYYPDLLRNGAYDSYNIEGAGW